ncbi:sodium-dependent glucose transporter 1A-like [Lingula anatina]|uniref:Sodium-dependent glucose transporter 1A-like n=1 Tax=Lingula anatina TaxID=7574 RepID=A0A1S3IUF0_LINAN|nr:sodium-dependent glucose transporter 1A-like [Lingula anatina]|eukprot:XP_013401835.1 sodium-dependent glucose transporter 1A-like [Lingula anatina]
MDKTTEKKESEKNDLTEKAWPKVVKNIYINLIWIALGMALELTGPSLQDLKDRVDSNYEEIARAVIGRSAGFFVGSFGGGFLCDRFQRHVDLILVAFLCVAAVGTFAIPWCSVLPLLWFMFVLQGMSEGVLATGAHVVILRLWGEETAPSVYSLHLSYGIGAFLSPLVAKPFLSKSSPITDDSKDGNMSLFANLSTHSPFDLQILQSTPAFETVFGALVSNITNNITHANSTSYVVSQSTIEYGYSIAGIALSVMIPFGLFFQIKRFPKVEIKIKDPTFVNIFSPGTCAEGDTVFGFKIFILLFLFYFHGIGGVEHSWGKYLFSFARESENHFSKDEAAVLNSVYWGGFCLGRISGVLFSKWVHPAVLLVIVLSGNITSSAILAFIGYRDRIVMWVFTFLFGVTVSVIFGACVAWTNHYMTVTGMAVGVLYIGTAAGGLLYQWLAGYLLQYYGPNAMMYMILACGVVAGGLFATMQFLMMTASVKDNEKDSVSDKGSKNSVNEYELVNCDEKVEDMHKEDKV